VSAARPVGDVPHPRVEGVERGGRPQSQGGAAGGDHNGGHIGVTLGVTLGITLLLLLLLLLLLGTHWGSHWGSHWVACCVQFECRPSQSAVKFLTSKILFYSASARQSRA